MTPHREFSSDKIDNTCGTLSSRCPGLVKVDLQTQTNNVEHHTSEISLEQLVLRRGQSFKLTIELAELFDPNRDPLNMSAQTGLCPVHHKTLLPSYIAHLNFGSVRPATITNKIWLDGTKATIW